MIEDRLPDLLLPTLLVERALARLLAGMLKPAACNRSVIPVNPFSETRAESSCIKTHASRQSRVLTPDKTVQYWASSKYQHNKATQMLHAKFQYCNATSAG